MTRSVPVNREVSFDHHELFFSRTNKKGIIQFGNSVFIRVSGFPAETLINAPHKIIRHPDVPRCVFKLFWTTIQAGQPIGAYVKNMSQDGSYYWVFAVTFPTENGYVSLRLKPSSPLFVRISEVYKNLLVEESSLGMDASLEILLKTLKDLGFESYESFMTHALVEELRSRDQILKGREGVEVRSKQEFFALGLGSIQRSQSDYSRIFNSLIQMLGYGNSLKTCAQAILLCFSDLTFLSLNMAVGAAKVGADGRALAEVANGFRSMAEQIQAQVRLFDQKLATVIAGIAGSQFQIGCSRLQVEMIRAFLAETALETEKNQTSASADFFSNYRLLLDLCTSSSQAVTGNLDHLRQTFKELIAVAEDLLSILNGLEVIRLTGKVEAARLNEEHRESFDNHIEQMTDFVEKLSTELKKVRNLGRQCFDELGKSLGWLNSTAGYIALMPQKESPAEL